MRILHTSDWHLGKRLFKLDRLPEQEMFLQWLVEVLQKEKIELLLIAGDIFDTPTPPHQALELFYNFLHRVSVETSAETYIIAGNHDSGLLLEAPSKILAPHRVKVWGKLSSDPKDHWIRFKNLDICCIPFFRSYELLPQGEGDALKTLENYLRKESSAPFSLLMLHHLAGMYEAAGSEQAISLSGVDSIPKDILTDFDYVALGHIHKPQRIGEKIYYSGSPIPLRFSETAKKSVVIIEESEGKLIPNVFPIPVFRDLFCVKTCEKNYQEDLKNLTPSSSLEGMAEVQIQLTSPRTGLIDEIKTILGEKNIELLSFMPLYQTAEKKEHKSDKLFQLSPLELFQEFYATKFPEAKELPEDLESDFVALLDKVKNATPTS